MSDLCWETWTSETKRDPLGWTLQCSHAHAPSVRPVCFKYLVVWLLYDNWRGLRTMTDFSQLRFICRSLRKSHHHGRFTRHVVYFSLKTTEAAGIFGLSWASFSLHENFVSIWFVGKPQDIKLRPLNEFLERNFNCLNSMPMYKWLLPTLDGELEYQQRMHLLGNIVVPACGALASDILLRMHRQQWRLLLEGLLEFLMIVPSTVSSMVGFKTSFKQCSLLCCFCRLPSLQAESRTPSVKPSRRSNSEFQ